MKNIMKNAVLAAAITLGTSLAFAQDDTPAQTLFTNVHVFDGVNEARILNASVLVEGNLIKTVSMGAIDAPNATVIDAVTHGAVRDRNRRHHHGPNRSA